MKSHAFLIGLALAATVGPVLAQEPPGPPATPNAQMREQFEATHKQMEQIHAQERSQILGALTPAHRQLLATIAGQLATSTTPDYRGAAERLDSALSSAEKQTIINASQSARQKMRAQMESMRQQMAQMGPPPPGASGQPPKMMGMTGGRLEAQGEPTAGAILLRVAMSGGMEMHMQMGASMRIDHP